MSKIYLSPRRAGKTFMQKWVKWMDEEAPVDMTQEDKDKIVQLYMKRLSGKTLSTKESDWFKKMYEKYKEEKC